MMGRKGTESVYWFLGLMINVEILVLDDGFICFLCYLLSVPRTRDSQDDSFSNKISYTTFCWDFFN